MSGSLNVDTRRVVVRVERADGGLAANDVRAALEEQRLDRGEGRRDVEDVVVADVPDPEHPRAELAVRPRDRDPEPVAELEHELSGIHSVGGEDRRDDGRSLLVRREELQAHRLDALAAGAAERGVTSERALHALLEEHAQRHVERGDDRDGGRERRRSALERRLRARPVEVVAGERRPRGALPGGLRDDSEREARRRHERLLRPGHDDVEAPRVRLQRHRAEARDGVDDDERAGLARDARERLDVGDDACGRLGMHEHCELSPRLLEPRAQVLGTRRLSPCVAKLLDVCAVRGRERRPAVAERTGGDDEDALSRREEVHDRRLERTGSRGA